MHLQHKNDDEFALNVESNSLRYLRHFEDVADELMPPSIGIVEDVYDILNVRACHPPIHISLNMCYSLLILLLMQGQRENQAQQTAEQQHTAPNIPKSLTRRFEVTLLPRLSEKPRKLREVRANGTSRNFYSDCYVGYLLLINCFVDIGKLVMVKGMVTRISDVKPQVAVVTYTCDACGSEIFQEISGTQFRPLDRCPSQRCKDNDTVGKLQMQTRGSRFVKYQVCEFVGRVYVSNVYYLLIGNAIARVTRPSASWSHSSLNDSPLPWSTNSSVWSWRCRHCEWYFSCGKMCRPIADVDQ